LKVKVVDPVHTMKAYKEVEVWFHSFFTSALGGSKWSVGFMHWPSYPSGKFIQYPSNRKLWILEKEF
jgi:hypothetical protein